MDEDSDYVFDASDLTWPGLEGESWHTAIVGDFEIRLNLDAAEGEPFGQLLADDDALVVPLDQP